MVVEAVTMKTLKELRGNPLLIGKQHSSLGQLEYLHAKHIDMDVYLPTKKMNLQRGNVWELWQQQEIIMSILIRRFIPAISVIAYYSPDINRDVYQIIDGKQRLTAMMEFIANKFPLNLEEGDYSFSELPYDYRMQIEGFIIEAHIIYDGNIDITDEDKIEWFSFINFNQTPQDVEHLQRLRANV